MKMNQKYTITELLEAINRTNAKAQQEALEYIKSDKEVNYSFYSTWEVDDTVSHATMEYITVTAKENDNKYRAVVEGIFADGYKEICYITKHNWRFERTSSNEIINVME